MKLQFLFVCAALLLSQARIQAKGIPADFPQFSVPNHDAEMNSLRALFWHHYAPAGPLIPLWDEWMPMSTLWPAMGQGNDLDAMRHRWSQALLNRPMDEEGYVLTEQHDGLAHAEGWPFPLWTQAGGIGWHFRGTGIHGYDAPTLARPEQWQVTHAKSGDVDDHGWIIHLTAPHALIQPPAFSIKASAGPWLRLNWWSSGLQNANCYLEWTTQEHPQFSADRRAYFTAAAQDGSPGKIDVDPSKITYHGIEARTMVPVFRLPGWSGTITGVRIAFDNPGPATVVIKSFHTACDSRQSVNNLNLIRGSHDYFLWTRDITFLRTQMPRLRTAMRFEQREFDTLKRKCLYTTWPGHEGRSGVQYIDGKKTILVGNGIGSNYWDILPFGGEDALGTIYYYDACRDLADLEELILAHPRWCIPGGADAYNPDQLRTHAQEVKDYGDKRFWNEMTGRFGTVDLDGKMHDYGFTFLNNEAVHYGFATPDQAKSIHAWLSGQRTVEGDTATGADIYHFRFGPRSTTRRNLDYYFWGWSSPESIAFGDQVQDGGAVLGWSYHDLMQRLMTAGPDDAATRLAEIANWFNDTQSAGGYRKYYEGHPERGTMQGGNIPGGLGLDKEFMESVLMPQVMLYGFLGFHPTADGCRIEPKLPHDWPKLSITRIHLHEHVLDVTASSDKTITITGTGPADDPIAVTVPSGWKVVPAAGLSVNIQSR